MVTQILWQRCSLPVTSLLADAPKGKTAEKAGHWAGGSVHLPYKPGEENPGLRQVKAGAGG